MQKDFTLIEAMIVLVILAILAAIFMGGAGRRHTSCEAGYIFAHGYKGHLAQVLDAQGHGIPCNK